MGSSHGSREGSQSQNSPASLGPYQPNQFNNNRLDRATDNMGLPMIASPQLIQRSVSTPDNLHMQVVINNMWPKHARGGPQNYSPLLQHSSSNNRSTQQQPNRAMPSSPNFVPSVQPQSSGRNLHIVWHSEKSPVTQRQQAYSSYQSNNDNFTQDARFQDHNPDRHYRGNRESEYRQDQTTYYSRSWEHDYKVRREYPRGGRR